jgi:N-methylhydantoinase A
VISEYREYERGVTATVNACIQPVLDRYISRLREGLAERGYPRDLLVMQGNGGTVSSRIVAEAAVKTVMSGPASGVMAAAYTAKAAGVEDVITYDMGGTSCDVGLIRGGVPEVSSELELEYAMPIHVPMVDVHSIGAGGGSIALVNDAGILQVGPQSAGADPGPICYGRGGQAPTITDANLLLGRLNPEALLAVDHPVSLDEVRAVFARELGEKLGLDTEQAATAVLRIANDRMAGALRLVSLARGHDPRDFALFAFGGAGPLHASALAKELAIPRVLVPARPGITNALGCLAADVRHDYVNTVNAAVPSLDMDRVREVLEAQIAEGQATIAREGVEIEGLTVLHSADMQFLGQSHILTVPVPGTGVTREQLQEAFESAYWDRFEVALPEILAVLVNLNTAVIGRRPSVPLESLAETGGAQGAPAGAETETRQVWWADGWRETPIYQRGQLPPGATLTGPAIVEQLDTTIVIEPGDNVSVDALSNLIIEVGAP